MLKGSFERFPPPRTPFRMRQGLIAQAPEDHPPGARVVMVLAAVRLLDRQLCSIKVDYRETEEETDRDKGKQSSVSSTQNLVATTSTSKTKCVTANKPACQGARDASQELNHALRLENSGTLYSLGLCGTCVAACFWKTAPNLRRGFPALCHLSPDSTLDSQARSTHGGAGRCRS